MAFHTACGNSTDYHSLCKGCLEGKDSRPGKVNRTRNMPEQDKGGGDRDWLTLTVQSGGNIGRTQMSQGSLSCFMQAYPANGSVLLGASDTDLDLHTASNGQNSSCCMILHSLFLRGPYCGESAQRRRSVLPDVCFSCNFAP